MSRESRKHFSHRNGNGLVTSKKTSRYQKVCHSIKTPERCFKNRCWLGKEQSPDKLLTSVKYICTAIRMNDRAALIPTGCHVATDKEKSNHLIRIG